MAMKVREHEKLAKCHGLLWSVMWNLSNSTPQSGVTLNGIFQESSNFTDLSPSLTNLLVSITQNPGVWG